MAKKTAKTTKKRSSSSAKAPDATGKHLVIVESPTKAKTINKYLGKDYVVMASVGHVRDLPNRAPKGEKQPVPGVDIENNFEPTYQILPDKKSTVSALRKAAKQASDVWFATDLDREGEAIAWHLAASLNIDIASAKRVVFNAITKGEIERAFDKPRSIDAAKVDAQQARRILDRIVGYQVSPFLWKKVAGKLSAGRVQSVATRLVVEREREIEAFTPDEYWRIGGVFTVDIDKSDQLSTAWRTWLSEAEEGSDRTQKDQTIWLNERRSLKAELVEYAGKTFKAVNVDQAEQIAQSLGFSLDDRNEWHDPKAKGPQQNRVELRGALNNPPAFAVRSIETRRTTSKPGAPFITSTLQQTASTRLSFPLQRTMRVAQQLYEGIDIKGSEGQTGLITYMRTDSTFLSGEALNMARSYIQNEFGDKYLPEKPNFYSSSNKAAQEAHEAIRPTDVSITPSRVRDSLRDDQYRLYKLIWERFVSCQMLPAKWDSTTVLIESRNEAAEQGVFKATGRTLIFDGFYKVTGVPQSEDTILPPLEENQPMAPLAIEPSQHFTSPPARYTEASLQKKLEEEGIGRPSTYAAIISTIQDRNYTEQMGPRDRRLRATDLGKVVTDMLVLAFPTIMDVAYTRNMEEQLDKVEEEHIDWHKMLSDFYGPFAERLERAHKEMQHAKAATIPSPFKCPKCGAPTEYRFGRNGQFLSCTRFNVPPAEVKVESEPGSWLLYKAKGKARPKILSPDGKKKVGWSKLTADEKKRFQKISDDMETCDYAAPIDREGKPKQEELTDIACPNCGKPMQKRSGRFGPFLGCVDYPECSGILNLDKKSGAVTLPKVPPLTTDLPCPKCESPLYMRDSKRGFWLSCSTFPKCRGRQAWSSIEEAKQKELEKAWDAHAKENPLPTIKTVDGTPVGENYIPQTAEGEGQELERIDARKD